MHLGCACSLSTRANLAGDCLTSGAVGDSGESYLLGTFPPAMVCKHAKDKMGETRKTGAKRVLWQFQPWMHLSACPRDAGVVGSPSACG